MELSPFVSSKGFSPVGIESAHCHHSALNCFKEGRHLYPIKLPDLAEPLQQRTISHPRREITEASRQQRTSNRTSQCSDRMFLESCLLLSTYEISSRITPHLPSPESSICSTLLWLSVLIISGLIPSPQLDLSNA